MSTRYLATIPNTHQFVFAATEDPANNTYSTYDSLMQAIQGVSGFVTVMLKTSMNVVSDTVYSWNNIKWETDAYDSSATAITFPFDDSGIGPDAPSQAIIRLGENVTLRMGSGRSIPLRTNASTVVFMESWSSMWNDSTAPMFEVPSGYYLSLYAKEGSWFVGNGPFADLTTGGILYGTIGATSDYGPKVTMGTGVVDLTYVGRSAYESDYASQLAHIPAANNRYNRPAWVPFISRATMTGNVSDYRPNYFREAGLVFLDANGANRTISGFDAGVLGPGFESAFSCVPKYVVNISTANTITLQNQNVGSSVNNRIQTQTNADIVIPVRGCAVLFYDDVALRWRAFLNNS